MDFVAEFVGFVAATRLPTITTNSVAIMEIGYFFFYFFFIYKFIIIILTTHLISLLLIRVIFNFRII